MSHPSSEFAGTQVRAPANASKPGNTHSTTAFDPARSDSGAAGPSLASIESPTEVTGREPTSRVSRGRRRIWEIAHEVCAVWITPSSRLFRRHERERAPALLLPASPPTLVNGPPLESTTSHHLHTPIFLRNIRHRVRRATGQECRNTHHALPKPTLELATTLSYSHPRTRYGSRLLSVMNPRPLCT